MLRIAAVLILLAGAVVVVLAQSGSSGADCSHLEREVAELNERVRTLERELRAASAPKTKPTPAAPRPAAKREVDPFYGKIDGLLADGEIEAAQEALAERKSTDQRSPMLNTLTREMAVVGKPTPDSWGIEKWYQGQRQVNLEQGTTLLIFWETWCPHCKNEVPRLAQLYDRLKPHGLQMLGLTRITKTATEQAVVEFLAETQVSYPMAKEDGSVAEHFNVKGIPAAAVVRGGKIIWRGHPLRLTDNMIKGWL